MEITPLSLYAGICDESSHIRPWERCSRPPTLFEEYRTCKFLSNDDGWTNGYDVDITPLPLVQYKTKSHRPLKGLNLVYKQAPVVFIDAYVFAPTMDIDNRVEKVTLRNHIIRMTDARCPNVISLSVIGRKFVRTLALSQYKGKWGK